MITRSVGFLSIFCVLALLPIAAFSEEDAPTPPAPKSTQQAIDEAKETANDAIEAAKQAILDAIDRAREITSSTLEAEKDAAERALDEAKEATKTLDQASQAAREVLESAKKATAEVLDKAREATTTTEGVGDSSTPFFARMVLGDVTFEVESPNNSSINQVMVRAEGPEGPIGQAEAEADGTITRVEVEDLNADGYPEIYVYVTSAGSGSYGSLIAYASNRNKSLSPINLPSIEDDPAISSGYMGHDEFAVGEGAFLRRFPIYEDGDTNAQPTGGTRQIQYKLEDSEAGWVLRQDRVVEF